MGLMLSLLFWEDIIGRGSVAGAVPAYAARRLELNRDGNSVRGNPFAKAVPMHSKLVKILDQSECGDVHLAGIKSINFRGLRWVMLFGYRIKNEFVELGIVRREENIHLPEVRVLLLHFEGRRRIGIDKLYNPVCLQVCDRGFADIRQCKWKIDRSILAPFRRRQFNFYPTSLFRLKVPTKIPPFEIGDHSIPNSNEYADEFESRFPPLKGLVPGLLGLLGIFWGGCNLRFERRLPLSGIVFLGGCFEDVPPIVES